MVVEKIVNTQSASASKSNSRPRYDVDGRYQALLDAGELLLCCGYEQAQPKRVAEAADVSVGLFYKHFSGKRELLSAVMVRRLDLLHQRIENAITQQISPEHSLKTVIEKTLGHFDEHQGLIKLFFLEIGYGDVQSTQRLSASRQNYRRLLRSIIERGAKQKAFIALTPIEMELQINSIVGTVNWTVYELLVVKKQTLNPSVLAANLLTIFLRSLRL